jgi:hypothetical protein
VNHPHCLCDHFACDQGRKCPLKEATVPGELLDLKEQKPPHGTGIVLSAALVILAVAVVAGIAAVV